MKLALITLSVLLLSSSFALFSQQNEHAEDKFCCSTYDTGQCLIKVEQKVDAELNDTYQKALKQWTEPEESEGLRKAQRAWITYRDANCNAELATYEHGSMGPNMFGFCQIRLTRQRTEEIKSIYLSSK